MLLKRKDCYVEARQMDSRDRGSRYFCLFLVSRFKKAWPTGARFLQNLIPVLESLSFPLNRELRKTLRGIHRSLSGLAIFWS